MHIATPLIQFGEPRRFMNRRPMPISTLVFQLDVETANASGPCSSTTRRSRSAMSLMASSHDTSSHWPEPRSPTRRSGVFSRSGRAYSFGAVMPLKQKFAATTGLDGGATLSTSPSRTCTSSWHAMSHTVHTAFLTSVAPMLLK
ncbi:MAG: hypothetical protein JWM31_2381 [Solirubrobacterales bacterium]|nr:hypothetical protein [Solirubrobacterales bacterium]